MRALQKNKVILGLSGGVDSTTAALLLKEKGYDVIGLFLDVQGNNTEGREEAAEAAEELGIEFVYKDVSKSFDDVVVKNFCSEYICGRTPNPCVVCNPNIKFRTLIEAADEMDAQYIATGHYARIVNLNGYYYVQQAASIRKDQSYMLYHLGQDVLSRLLFPLGDFENKVKTREVAAAHNLFNAQKADSQEICFIPDGKKSYVDFIERKYKSSLPGDFIDGSGKVIGRHKGLLYYTIGQRKGLGITVGRQAFVTKMDPKSNTVTLGNNEDLFKHSVISKDNFFVIDSTGNIPRDIYGKQIFGKIRYAAGLSACNIETGENGEITALFNDAQRAATPGQSIVFYAYDSDNGVPYVIGGGIIESDY